MDDTQKYEQINRRITVLEVQFNNLKEDIGDIKKNTSDISNTLRKFEVAQAGSISNFIKKNAATIVKILTLVAGGGGLGVLLESLLS